MSTPIDAVNQLSDAINRRDLDAHMKAFVVAKYGKSALRAAQVPEPSVGSRDVLLRVSAASLGRMARN